VEVYWSDSAHEDQSIPGAGGTNRHWPEIGRRRWRQTAEELWELLIVWSVTPATTVVVVRCRVTPDTISSATSSAPTTARESVWMAGMAASATPVSISPACQLCRPLSGFNFVVPSYLQKCLFLWRRSIRDFAHWFRPVRLHSHWNEYEYDYELRVWVTRTSGTCSHWYKTQALVI